MNYLSPIVRLASLGLGCLVVVASLPIALLAGAAPSDTVSDVSPLLYVPLAALVLASGFLYVGIAARRLAASGWHRLVAGLLLAIPLVAGVFLLLTPPPQRLHPFGVLLVASACVVLVCAIWPFQLTFKPR
jgi:hypothetical protein